MKTTLTMSIESNLAAKFVQLCDEKGLSKNRTIEHLMGKFVHSHDARMVQCETCGAAYSNNLTECPQCRLKRIVRENKKELASLEIKRKKYQQHVKKGSGTQEELDKIDMDIDALKKAIGEINA